MLPLSVTGKRGIFSVFFLMCTFVVIILFRKFYALLLDHDKSLIDIQIIELIGETQNWKIRAQLFASKFGAVELMQAVSRRLYVAIYYGDY